MNPGVTKTTDDGIEHIFPGIEHYRSFINVTQPPMSFLMVLSDLMTFGVIQDDFVMSYFAEKGTWLIRGTIPAPEIENVHVRYQYMKDNGHFFTMIAKNPLMFSQHVGYKNIEGAQTKILKMVEALDRWTIWN